MGGFGDGVSVLLDTYTRCLELLKAPTPKGRRDSDAASRSEARSRLRASMRSDRAQIRQAYASSLSLGGSRLEAGDARSRSAIRRILDRIRTAMRPLLGTTRKSSHAAVDYGSLVSLSNTSRHDALRAMDRLSQRLGQAGSRAGSRRSSRRVSSPVATGGAKHEARHKTQTQANSRSRSRSRSSVHARITKRLSYVTTSSDSTQLGEIPHRPARRHRHSDASSERSYGTQPIYPLYAYGPEPKKPGFLRRLFSNGK